MTPVTAVEINLGFKISSKIQTQKIRHYLPLFPFTLVGVSFHWKINIKFEFSQGALFLISTKTKSQEFCSKFQDFFGLGPTRALFLSLSLSLSARVEVYLWGACAVSVAISSINKRVHRCIVTLLGWSHKITWFCSKLDKLRYTCNFPQQLFFHKNWALCC